MSNSTPDFMTASQLFSTYISSINFGLGIIGNLLNILVLTNLKIFRLNRCAFYLIVESVVDIGQVCQFFTAQISQLSMNGVDPGNISPIWCRLRTPIGQWSRMMLSSIVCFAAVDQYLTTNPAPYLRQWSSLKLAHYQVYIVGSLCLLHVIPFAIFSQIDPKLGCTIYNIYLANYFAYFYYPFLNGLLPIFIASLFSLLSYRNVRRIIRRQIPIERRRLDQQLTAMIFMRVIFFVLLELPYTIHRIIVLNVSTIPTNTTGYVINLWVRTISAALAYISHGVIFFSFY
jgi:hypothetical protein